MERDAPPKSMRSKSVSRQLFCILLVTNSLDTLAYFNCTEEKGGGICPDGNSCCRMSDGKSGCISSDLGQYNATCCDDGVTGCGVGYVCRTGEGDCLEDTSSSLSSSYLTFFDPLVKILPRYRLCRSPEIETLYGFQLDDDDDDDSPNALAYYSSHGPIETVTSIKEDVDMILLVIHGANRNADDYFCSVLEATKLQGNYKNVMVIAPQFFAESDNRYSPSWSFLYWEDSRDGPWRYGANAVGMELSSFAVLDKLVEALVIPKTASSSLSSTTTITLRKLVIVGHSSGGQMVQRWALLTPVWYREQMKAVVANPSSYVYLSPLRWDETKWNLPPKETCLPYNQWEWGLEEGGDLDVQYKDEQIRNHTLSFVIDRYKTRRVDYLIGSLDTCNVSSPGWCDSHGLETTCMDELQGYNRFKRNSHYMALLQRLGFSNRYHAPVVVPNVGHDHALMFQSPEGLKSIFETTIVGTIDLSNSIV